MQILAVVVRYNMAFADSKTIKGLCAALSSNPDLANGYSVMIWDNSPEQLIGPELPIQFSYRHSERNLGVSGAYNGAMKYALDQGNTWMLLLDQDSTVTTGFLQTMLQHARELKTSIEVAAIAPNVKVGTLTVSPKKQLFGRNRSYPIKECGIASGEAIAINSGCIIRTSSLQEIGGFSIGFWLDYSDLYVFHQLYLHGKKVWRAADAELEHDMSIMDYDRLMTPSRYRNFSYAESAFQDLYKTRAENLLQTLRLFARAIKQRLKYKNPEFSRIAWATFQYRLRVSRKDRIQKWIDEGKRRLESIIP